MLQSAIRTILCLWGARGQARLETPNRKARPPRPLLRAACAPASALACTACAEKLAEAGLAPHE
eukprot:13050915-Alexandrium_andersonii.AAC.1